MLRSKGIIRDAIVLALNTGMRRGEILGLQWSQVDFERGFIKVLKTKSGKSRFIPMNTLVFVTLKELQKQKAHDVFLFWNERTRKPMMDIKKGFKKGGGGS